MSGPKGIRYEIDERIRSELRRKRAEYESAKTNYWKTHYEAVDCLERLRNLARETGQISLTFDPLPTTLLTATRKEYEAGTKALRQQVVAMESSWRDHLHPRITPLRVGTETPAARVLRYLQELDPTVLPDDDMLRLSEAASQATSDLGDLLADRLQIRIGHANQAALTRRANEAKINDIAARIAVLSRPAPELLQELEVARETAKQGGTLDVAQLTAYLVRAETTAEAEAERAWVTKVVADGLEDLGYVVSNGFDTLSPGAEGLVRRTIWNHHALSVGISGGEVSLAVVRTADEELSHLSAVRDKEVETSWCEDFPRLLIHLEQHGVVPGRVRQVAAGLVAVRRIDAGRVIRRRPHLAVQQERGMK